MGITRTFFVGMAVWFAVTAGSFAANPHLGTWKLNENKSKLSPGGMKNTAVTYTEGKDGVFSIKVDGINKAGPTHWTWRGKFDGKQNNVKGTVEIDTIAFRMVNNRTNSFTAMKAGKVTATGTIAVSKDGKSRIVTTTATGANGKKTTDKAYYDKG